MKLYSSIIPVLWRDSENGERRSIAIDCCGAAFVTKTSPRGAVVVGVSTSARKYFNSALGVVLAGVRLVDPSSRMPRRFKKLLRVWVKSRNAVLMAVVFKEKSERT